jgi:hypothetical protein
VHAHPDLFGLHGVIQGRPVFSVLLLGTRWLASWLGPDAMGTVRLAAILLLAVYGVLTCRILDRHLRAPLAAFGSTVALLTLPAFQVYAAAGPWLTVALVTSTIAFMMARRALDDMTAPRRTRLSAAIVAMAALGLSLGVYQAVAQIYVAFVLLAFLFEPRPAEKITLARYAGYAAIWAASLVAYWALWTLVYDFFFPALVENRYSPGNVANPLDKLAPFFVTRLTQVLNLWDVTAGGDARSLVWYGAVSLLLAGLGADALGRARERGLPGLAEAALRIAAVLAAWIASDAAVLASRATINTYTTVAALSQAVFFTLLWALAALLAAVPGEARPRLRWIAFAAAGAGAILAQSSALRYFTAPLSREARLVRAAIVAAAPGGQTPDPIIVRIVDKATQERAYGEYSWNNLNHEFYVNWFVRNQLWQLGLDQRVEIIAIDRKGERLPPMRLGGSADPAVARPVCIDLRPFVQGAGPRTRPSLSAYEQEKTCGVDERARQ